VKAIAFCNALCILQYRCGTDVPFEVRPRLIYLEVLSDGEELETAIGTLEIGMTIAFQKQPGFSAETMAGG
jgi:hypothetical protein